MRKIIFRGKGIGIDNRFFVGNLVQRKQKTYIHYGINSVNNNREYTVKPETVGQFTGLTDKNGVEIYEGDILETFEHGQIRLLYIVEFKHGCFNALLNKTPLCLEFNHVESEQIKVIGNIHDNPELLK